MNLNDIKPIPGFSCVEMKRKAQERIYEETKGMSDAELLAYYRRKSKQFKSALSSLKPQIILCMFALLAGL